MTMVERVARAICLQDNIADGYADSPTLRQSIEMGMWSNYVTQARAAIEALRLPTLAMIVAADKSATNHQVWQAMIEKAADGG